MFNKATLRAARRGSVFDSTTFIIRLRAHLPPNPVASFQDGDEQDQRDNSSSSHQARNVALPVVRRVRHGIEDQRPPRHKGKVERVHPSRGDGAQLQIVRRHVGHPRVPQGLGRVRRTEEVEGKEDGPVTAGTRDEDGTADDEGCADGK